MPKTLMWVLAVLLGLHFSESKAQSTNEVYSIVGTPEASGQHVYFRLKITNQSDFDLCFFPNWTGNADFYEVGTAGRLVFYYIGFDGGWPEGLKVGPIYEGSERVPSDGVLNAYKYQPSGKQVRLTLAPGESIELDRRQSILNLNYYDSGGFNNEGRPDKFGPAKTGKHTLRYSSVAFRCSAIQWISLKRLQSTGYKRLGLKRHFGEVQGDYFYFESPNSQPFELRFHPMPDNHFVIQ